jgi:hypothetical protein
MGISGTGYATPNASDMPGMTLRPGRVLIWSYDTAPSLNKKDAFSCPHP